jgi:hypothetical protein
MSGLFWGHWVKLGRCTKCMRQSSLVCIVSLIALVLTLWIGVPAAITFSASVFAALATALFIGHVSSFARNKVVAEERGGMLGRRRALKVAVGAAASAFSVIATNRPARAASRCGGWRGECGKCEKNFRLDQRKDGCHVCDSCNCGRGQRC